MAKKKLTKRELQAIPVSKIEVKKDTKWGEYQTRVYRGRHLDPWVTRLHSDKEDAMASMAEMKKHYGLAGMRRRSYRFGAAEDAGPLKVTPGSRFEIEPASGSGSKKQFLPFLTPKVGNTLVGVGALAAIGAVGYYIYKGGELGNLWGELFGKSAGGGSGGSASQTLVSTGTPSARNIPWSQKDLYQPALESGVTWTRPPATGRREERGF